MADLNYYAFSGGGLGPEPQNPARALAPEQQAQRDATRSPARPSARNAARGARGLGGRRQRSGGAAPWRPRGAVRHGTAPRAARRHCSRPARRGTPAAQPRQRSGVGSAARCGRCARGRSECSPCSVIDLDSLSFASGIFHPLEYGVWGPFHH